jgi:hypothetical protein
MSPGLEALQLQQDHMLSFGWGMGLCGDEVGFLVDGEFRKWIGRMSAWEEICLQRHWEGCGGG